MPPDTGQSSSSTKVRFDSRTSLHSRMSLTSAPESGLGPELASTPAQSWPQPRLGAPASSRALLDGGSTRGLTQWGELWCGEFSNSIPQPRRGGRSSRTPSLNPGGVGGEVRFEPRWFDSRLSLDSVSEFASAVPQPRCGSVGERGRETGKLAPTGARCALNPGVPTGVRCRRDSPD